MQTAQALARVAVANCDTALSQRGGGKRLPTPDLWPSSEGVQLAASPGNVLCFAGTACPQRGPWGNTLF